MRQEQEQVQVQVVEWVSRRWQADPEIDLAAAAFVVHFHWHVEMRSREKAPDDPISGRVMNTNILDVLQYEWYLE